MAMILLVDDDSAVRSAVGNMLERSGYSVLSAEDGGTAIALLQARNDIALVIADYRMPNMDGLMLARRIREREPDLPVILMTGYSDLESYQAAAHLGVHCYVDKPVGLRTLQRTVQDALSGRPAQRPRKPS